MKTIKIQNPKKQRAKRYLLFSALILVVSGLMIYNAFTNNKNLKEDNFDLIKGTVEVFEVVDNQYQLNISDLKDDKLSTALVLNVEVISTLPKIKDNVKLNDVVELVYDLDSKDIYKVTINNELLYNRLADAVESNNRLIIFYIIIGVLMFCFMVLNIISYIKQPHTKEIDYIEHIICNNNAITNSMLSQESTSMKLIQKDKLVNKAALIVGMFAVLASIMLKSIIPNKYILLAVCLLIVGGLISCLIIFKPKLYSKNLNIFINDYLDYLNNGKSKEERSIFLKKEGLKVIDNEQTYFFDYHELNLYTVCIYSKTNAPVNIFICSQLPEKEEYKDIQDFIIPLSKDLYSDIIENSIFVIGLEEVINNLNIEAEKAIKEIKEGYLLKHYK